MSTRMYDHGQGAFGTFIRLFKWAKGNRENPGCKLSLIAGPLGNLSSDYVVQGFHGFSDLLRIHSCDLRRRS